MKKKILVPLTKSAISQKILCEIEKFVQPEDSELIQKILCEIEKFVQPEDSELILFYVNKPPKGSGFAATDGSGFAATDYRSDYALEPDGEPLGPKAHPVFASQEEDSIRSEVEVALLSVTNDLKEKGYEITMQLCFVDE